MRGPTLLGARPRAPVWAPGSIETQCNPRAGPAQLEIFSIHRAGHTRSRKNASTMQNNRYATSPDQNVDRFNAALAFLVAVLGLGYAALQHLG